MEVKVLKVGEELPEVVEIKCHRINAQVSEIVAFVQSRQGQISGSCDGMQYEIPIVNLYWQMTERFYRIREGLRLR